MSPAKMAVLQRQKSGTKALSTAKDQNVTGRNVLYFWDDAIY